MGTHSQVQAMRIGLVPFQEDREPIGVLAQPHHLYGSVPLAVAVAAVKEHRLIPVPLLDQLLNLAQQLFECAHGD